MNIEEFQLERTQSLWESRIRYNLNPTGAVLERSAMAAIARLADDGPLDHERRTDALDRSLCSHRRGKPGRLKLTLRESNTLVTSLWP